MIVLAHPSRGSFGAAVAGELAAGIIEVGGACDLADLYAEGFDPVLSAEDLGAMEDGRIPCDVLPYHERVLRADAMAFVFPVWWFGMPAMMKGWIDRVFVRGFAFRFGEKGRIEGLLRHRKALILNTAGSSEELYEVFGFSEPIKKALGDWGLRFCGVHEVKHVLFNSVVETDDQTRARYLAAARGLGREFFA